MDRRTGPRLRIRKVNAPVRNPPVALRSLIEDANLFAALYGYSPDAESAVAFNVVDKLAVGRLEGFPSTVSCHLHGLAPSSRRLPHLPVSGAAGAEVDPPSIARPCVRVLCLRPDRLPASRLC